MTTREAWKVWQHNPGDEQACAAFLAALERVERLPSKHSIPREGYMTHRAPHWKGKR